MLTPKRAGGSQRCDACRKAGKNKSKLAQSLRKKANAAIGELPEYVGALFVGELDLSALDVVDSTAGGWTRTPYGSEVASTFGRQGMSGEEHNRGATPAVGEDCRSPYRRIHQHHSTSTTCKQNETSRSAHLDVPYSNNISDTHRQNMIPVEQTASPKQLHHHQICYSNGSRTETDQQNITRTVETAATQKANHHYRIHFNTSSETNTSNRNTVEEGKQAASRATHHVTHHNSSLPTRTASSSQPTRKRPWDL